MTEQARRVAWTAMAVCACGVALFSLMDVLMKQLSLILGAYSTLVWRSVVGTGISGALMMTQRPRWPAGPLLRLHLLRGVLIAAMAWLFFWALIRLPLAEAIALSFIAPIIALALAALLLRERIGRSAIIAALLGLLGVGVILSGRLAGAYDGEALWGAVAVLASAVLFAWNLVLQRQQAQLAEPVEISFFQNAIILLSLLPFAPFLLQAVPESSLWWNVAGAALLATLSQLALSWAYARAQAQQLIPLEYTAFLWAALLGWLVFAEPLSWTTLAGTALIIGGCLVVARQSPEMAAHVESELA